LNKVMHEHPLVSVLMITFNQEKFIAQAIESVLMQHVNFNYEIVIGEDCSTDQTRDIVLEYQEKNSDSIKLLLQDKNVGMHNNFIDTFYSCRGKYIALLEGDDYWTDPHKLQKQVDFLEDNPDFAICFHNMQIIYEDEPHMHRISNVKQKGITDIKTLALGNYIYTASCIFRKNFSEMPDWFNQCPVGDYPLHLLNAQYGKIKFINELMGVYRVHKGGVWGNTNVFHQREQWVKMIELIRDKFNNDTKKNLNKSLCNNSFKLAKYYLRSNNYEKYNFFLKKIINNNPNCLHKLATGSLLLTYFTKTKVMNKFNFKIFS
jgi:glycosyltransferase involved in cell wall biosynthesis